MTNIHNRKMHSVWRELKMHSQKSIEIRRVTHTIRQVVNMQAKKWLNMVMEFNMQRQQKIKRKTAPNNMFFTMCAFVWICRVKFSIAHKRAKL